MFTFCQGFHIFQTCIGSSRKGRLGLVLHQFKLMMITTCDGGLIKVKFYLHVKCAKKINVDRNHSQLGLNQTSTTAHFLLNLVALWLHPIFQIVLHNRVLQSINKQRLEQYLWLGLKQTKVQLFPNIKSYPASSC